MTETPTPPPSYPWLPLEAVLAWLNLEEGTPHTQAVELARQAAAAYCQDQRRDLLDLVDGVETFDASPQVQVAGLLAAARLFARRSTPTGLASFAEFGAAEVLRLDPDVGRLLGTGRHASPVVG